MTGGTDLREQLGAGPQLGRVSRFVAREPCDLGELEVDERFIDARLGLARDLRRRLEHDLLPFLEGIDPRVKNRLDRRRNLNLLDAARGSIGSCASRKLATGLERADRLLDEERIPAAPFGDALGETADRAMAAEQLARKPQGRLRLERLEGHLPEPWVVMPGGPVVGTVVRNDEGPVSGKSRDDLIENRLACAVEPLQILADDDDRFLSATDSQEILEQSDDLAAPRLRIDPRGRMTGLGHPKQLEDEGQCFAPRLTEEGQPAATFSRTAAASSCSPTSK